MKQTIQDDDDNDDDDTERSASVNGSVNGRSTSGVMTGTGAGDDSGHGSQSSLNRKQGGQKGFKENDGEITLAGVLDGVMDSRPSTSKT